MSKALLLAFALLFSVAWVVAQDQYPQNPSSQNPSSQNPSAGQGQTGSSASAQTVEGCLQGSGGNFTLTDKSGTTYQLQGDTSKLQKHVGHQVQITGPSSGSSASGTGQTSSGGMAQGGGQTLTVEKVKHVSETCKAGK